MTSCVTENEFILGIRLNSYPYSEWEILRFFDGQEAGGRRLLRICACAERGQGNRMFMRAP